MNVLIEGSYKNGYSKERKNRSTGEIVQDFIVQIEQKEQLENGQVKFSNYDIPMDGKFAGNYKDKKVGDLVKVPCFVYGENFAQIRITKSK